MRQNESACCSAQTRLSCSWKRKQNFGHLSIAKEWLVVIVGLCVLQAVTASGSCESRPGRQAAAGKTIVLGRCCIDGDVVAKTLGTITKSFCKIEYPVRTSTNWNASYALKLDRQAKRRLQELKEEGCAHEECKGFICAEFFPRCFWINETARGAFHFEVCKKTCEDCYKTCAMDQSARCGANPSQLELACTSSSSVLQTSWVLLSVTAAAVLTHALHGAGR